MAQAVNPAERVIQAMGDAALAVNRVNANREFAQKISENTSSQDAYQTTANALSSIDPDHPGAESAVYKWKAFAGKHLDSPSMRELFDPMERRLDLNRQQLSSLRSTTGIDKPVLNESGVIDWDATWEAGQKNLQEIQTRLTSWGDEGRYLYHNLREAGQTEFSAVAAADRSEKARQKLEAYQEAARGLGISATMSDEWRGRIMKQLAAPEASQTAVRVIGANGTPELLYGPGMGQYVYDMDQVKQWTDTLDPMITKQVQASAARDAEDRALYREKEGAEIQKTRATTKLIQTQVAEKQAEAAADSGTAEDGGQPETVEFNPQTFRFE